MAPFTAFSTLKWANAPVQLSRYNGLPSLELQGSPAPGVSTGTAMKAMEEMAAKLPPGTALQWTGLSYEEQQSSGQAPALYGLSLLIVFLCLAALYESWTIPLAVVLVVPLGIVGALLGAKLTGLDNNIYLQVGLITTMGLACKNAILIVEFAEERMRAGASCIESAVEGARLRLRPILMTSLAFVFGVLPLAIATRSRRRQPERDRPRGRRRHPDRDLPRDLLRALVLRVREALLPPRQAGAANRRLRGGPARSRPSSSILPASASPCQTRCERGQSHVFQQVCVRRVCACLGDAAGR